MQSCAVESEGDILPAYQPANTFRLASKLFAEQDVLIQYVVLRSDLWKDLGWPLGSLVAQACHASTAALWQSRECPSSQEYCSNGNLDHMHKACSRTCLVMIVLTTCIQHLA
jgi:hypothetical protein